MAVWRKVLSSKFWAAWKRLRIVNKVEHFRINILDFEEKYGKISACRAFNCFQTVSGRRTFGPFIAGTSATQFALQWLFAALHGQQPRPLFRAQAPLHGEEISTDPWSYLTTIANFNEKKLMYE